MLNKLLFIYLLSTIFFYNHRGQFHFVQSSPTTKAYFQQHKLILIKSFKNANYAKILSAFVSGNKKDISKKILKVYSKLNLFHLFTPSGLHLSSLYLFLIYFAKLFSKSKIKLNINYLKLLISVSSLVIFYLNKYFSLKRMVLFYLFKNMFAVFKIKIDHFYIFLLVFILDYYFGSFEISPLSFSYSFLFLGTILASHDSFKSKLTSLLFAQFLLSIIFQSEFSVINGIHGYLITSLFSVIFPILLINFLIPWSNFSEVILVYFNKLVIL